MQYQSTFSQVMIQMFLKGWNVRQLSQEADISYVSLRRKLRGESPFTLDEAFAIQAALQTDMPLDTLFERRKEEAWS